MTSYDLTDGHEPMSHAEIDALKKLAKSLPENPTIVNIGAADGVSTIAFLEERPDAFVFSIDIHLCVKEIENAKACGVDASRIVRLLGDSQAMGKSFPYEVDLVYVDGDHWGAGKDAEAWRDKAPTIAFHDFIPGPNPANNPGSVCEDVTAVLGEPDVLVDRVAIYG